ncbi:hypothetical protein ABID42_004273 [Arcicella rosea]
MNFTSKTHVFLKYLKADGNYLNSDWRVGRCSANLFIKNKEYDSSEPTFQYDESTTS